MKQRFDALTVLLNGPRHFLMDSITASGATKTGETIEAGGLELTERATIDLGLLDLLHRPYREQTINRDTIYTFKAGRPVFMLEAADGSRYVMQAYAQIVDKTLNYADLPALGAKLKLPSGWRYLVVCPTRTSCSARRQRRPWCRTSSRTPIRRTGSIARRHTFASLHGSAASSWEEARACGSLLGNAPHRFIWRLEAVSHQGGTLSKGVNGTA